MDNPSTVRFKNKTTYTEEFLVRAARADQSRGYRVQAFIAIGLFALGAILAFTGRSMADILFGLISLALAIMSYLFFTGEPKRRAHKLYQGFLHDYATQIEAVVTVSDKDVLIEYENADLASSFSLSSILELDKGKDVFVIKSNTGLSVPLDAKGFVEGTPAEFERFIGAYLK